MQPERSNQGQARLPAPGFFSPTFRKRILVLTGLLIIILQACTIPPQATPSDSPAFPFVPPTIAVTPTSTAAPTAILRPVATVQCVDALSFSQDITIPDGTEVVASSSLDKRWEVTNSGTCNWEAGYQLRLVDGPAMGAVNPQTLFPARNGLKATIEVQFTAPAQPGRYRSAWQAFNPAGQPFGDPIFIDIIVK